MVESRVPKLELHVTLQYNYTEPFSWSWQHQSLCASLLRGVIAVSAPESICISQMVSLHTICAKFVSDNFSIQCCVGSTN